MSMRSLGSTERILGTLFTGASTTVAVWVLLSAIGGCHAEKPPIQPAMSDEELASQLVEAFNNPGRTLQQKYPPPPDLTGCTRVEITSFPSIWRRTGLTPSVLDADEKVYVESLSTVVIEDPSQIQVLAECLQAGSYGEVRSSQERWGDVICYRGDEIVSSFADHGFAIRTQGGHGYRYSNNPIRLDEFAPRLAPLRLRSRCGKNLWRIGWQIREWSHKESTWPAPDEWSDWVLQRIIAGRGTPVADKSPAMKSILTRFACPSASEGRCHYAMNPHCEPNSPPDTVLLFETKAGWNQHGGPELFTFEHHDPRGGCVLLKGGDLTRRQRPTLKFIRTEEELHALRWK